jgi:hypothetical protein
MTRATSPDSNVAGNGDNREYRVLSMRIVLFLFKWNTHSGHSNLWLGDVLAITIGRVFFER